MKDCWYTVQNLATLLFISIHMQNIVPRPQRPIFAQSGHTESSHVFFYKKRLPGWEANPGPFDFIYFLIFTTLPLGHSGSPSTNAICMYAISCVVFFITTLAFTARGRRIDSRTQSYDFGIYNYNASAVVG
jgi:hypothetical protein